MAKPNSSRIQFLKSDIKRWQKSMSGIEYRDLSIETGIGETTLRNAILHGFGTRKTEEAITVYFESLKIPA